VVRAEMGELEATDSVVGYSPDSNDMSTEAEKSPLLRAVIKQRLRKSIKGWRRLSV
jgi:hypothetical protein